MNSPLKVCFDFDDTLDRTHIQDYARELIERGLEVWICTMRPSDLDHWEVKYPDGSIRKLPWTNDRDLYPVADELGIKREHIIFTGFGEKPEFIKDKDFVWLLDDDPRNIKQVNMQTSCIGVSSMSSGWRNKCERILEKK